MEIFKFKRLLCIYIIILIVQGCGSGGKSANSGNSQAGSTATMLIKGETLYALDRGLLKVIDIGVTEPIVTQKITITDSQTLHIYGDYLYVGGALGVDIFDVSIPELPLVMGSFNHFRSCDPVVVEDNIGYVTLLSGGSCGRIGPNRLDILDLEDQRRPTLISSLPMTNPFGLAKTPDFLAVCEETNGLTLVDVSNVNAAEIIDNYPEIKCFDLIYSNNTLITTSDNGISQYSIENTTLSHLSTIVIKNYKVR